MHDLRNTKLITRVKSPADHNNKNESVVKLTVLERRLYRLQYNCVVTVVYYSLQFPLHFRVFWNVYTFRHTWKPRERAWYICWKICDI